LAEKGLFVVIDGCEGTGKSTQIGWLAESFRQVGRDVILTLEPGGTDVGVAIRTLLLDPKYHEMLPMTELCLFSAARAQHCDQVIRPALHDGKVVVSDRYDAATYAYQGYAGSVGVETVRKITELTSGLDPDLALIFDLDPEIGMARKFGDEPDRIEQKALDFHQRVRAGFLAYAAERDYAIVIDADGTPHEVHRLVIEAANERLNLNLPVLDL
jgi:dTMP kinase